jgi:hypothetical protein
MTFRTAEGGALVEAFSERWSALLQGPQRDFDEGAAFNGLLGLLAAVTRAVTARS